MPGSLGGFPNTITLSCPEWGSVQYVRAPRAIAPRPAVWSAAREVRRSFLGNSTTFEKTAAPVFGQGVQDAPPPMVAEALSPGEERWAKTYRERSSSDVSVPLLTSAVSSGLAGLLALAGSLAVRSADLLAHPEWLRDVQLWIGHRWYVVAPSAMLVTMTYLWFGRQLPNLLDDETLIASAQGHERHPDPPPPVPQPPPAVEVIVPRDRKRGYSDKRGRLASPQSDHDGLWNYCAALANGTAFPSWEGGKGGPGARDFGYTGPEFDVWREQCVKAGLLEKRPGLNQGYALADGALGAFRAIAFNKMTSYEL